MTRISLRLPSMFTDWSGMSPVANLPVGFLRNTRLSPTLSLAVLLLLLFLAVMVVWVYYGEVGNTGEKTLEEPSRGSSEVDTGGRNYGIVIDAGSSGSKVQLFYWPAHDGDPAKLLRIEPLTDERGTPLVMKVEPGISTFADDLDGAYTSLRPLLSFALSHLPPSKHRLSSLYVLCTAGMRMLPEEKQELIINHLHRAIPLEYPFYLPQDGIEVISGKMEGVFSWLTINYLLRRFEPEYHTHYESNSGSSAALQTVNTVGSLDMGGASLQVAFEIPLDVPVPSGSTIDISLGCGIHDNQHKHRIYVNTYLGYGTNEARRRYYKLLGQLSSKNSSLPYVRDPCLPLHHQMNLTTSDRTVILRGLGDFQACRRALRPLLSQSPASCVDRTCKPDAFKKPPVKYESLEFYGTSEFWYTMRDVLRIGGKYQDDGFEKAAKEFCQTSWNVLKDRYKRHLYPYADSYRMKSQCIKSAWMSLILHDALGFPEGKLSLITTSTVSGQSVQWSLGALLYHTRFLPLREIQRQQMMNGPITSGDSSGHLFNFLTNSSFTLPFLVVLLVAVLLILCRQRRPPTYYSLSRSSSHLPLTRVPSSLALFTTGLSKSQSTPRLSQYS